MRKFQAILSLTVLCLTATAVSAQTTLTYYEADGRLTVENPTRGVTTLELISASGTIFSMCENATELNPPFDQCTAGKLFRLSAPPGDYNLWEVGAVMMPGLSEAELVADLGAGTSGSLAPSDTNPDNSLFADQGGWVHVPIPEPSSFALLGFGLLGLLRVRRK